MWANAQAVCGNKSPLKFFDTNLPKTHYCQHYILVQGAIAQCIKLTALGIPTLPKKGMPFTFRHLKLTSVHKMLRSDFMASLHNVKHNKRVFSFYLFIT